MKAVENNWFKNGEFDGFGTGCLFQEGLGFSACGFAGLWLGGGLKWFLVLCLVVGWWGFVWWFLSARDG